MEMFYNFGLIPKTEEIGKNLFFNQYYDPMKLDYFLGIEGNYNLDNSIDYQDYINETDKEKQFEKGVNYYLQCRQDLPFIEELAPYLVRSQMDNPISKSEMRKYQAELKKKQIEERKKKKEEEKRLKVIKEDIILNFN